MRSKLNLILTAFILFFSAQLWSQSGGLDIRTKVASTLPELDLQDKILFVNVWSSSSFDSRQNTKEFIRVSDIYKNAKLKNGLKGVCFVNICMDADVSMWSISVTKDGLTCDNNFENSNGKFDDLLNLLNNKTGSVVINNNAELIGQDLDQNNCFTFFRSLITR